ncbi:MAG: nitrile hydratase subunit beta [Rubrivivax sp.]|nr:nitrile hydratase subunit beta [Rubrivivax sp.]
MGAAAGDVSGTVRPGGSAGLSTPSWPTQADLGGRGGYGPVLAGGAREPEGELWHAAWEPRALAVTLAAGALGEWNIDMSRAARETLPEYPRLSYYEIWVQALERLLLQRGLAVADELQAGRAMHPPRPVARVLRAAEVAPALARGSPTERPTEGGAPPRFAVGQRVRTVGEVPPHHTRLPGYARGKRGVVQALRGRHVFADTHAQGLGEQPHWLYTVVFEGGELWGGAAPGAVEAPEAGTLQVSIDAWEPYLDPVDGVEQRLP